MQRLQQDLLHRLLPDWSRRLALQVGLLLELVQLEVVLPLRVLLEEAVAVAAPAASLWQAAAVPRLPGSSAPEHPDSYHRLPAALVPEAEELVQVKATRTRVNRDK